MLARTLNKKEIELERTKEFIELMEKKIKELEETRAVSQYKLTLENLERGKKTFRRLEIMRYDDFCNRLYEPVQYGTFAQDVFPINTDLICTVSLENLLMRGILLAHKEGHDTVTYEQLSRFQRTVQQELRVELPYPDDPYHFLGTEKIYLDPQFHEVEWHYQDDVRKYVQKNLQDMGVTMTNEGVFSLLPNADLEALEAKYGDNFACTREKSAFNSYSVLNFFKENELPKQAIKKDSI